MYAAVITASFAPDQLDDSLQFYQQHILPTVQQGQGFRGVTICANRQTNQLIGIVLYETEADARAPETSGLYQQALEQMAARFITGTPTREVYEVLLQA
jgi:hypothetical protein